jgi:hypothetical protein
MQAFCVPSETVGGGGMFGFGKRSEGTVLKEFDPHPTPTRAHSLAC